MSLNIKIDQIGEKFCYDEICRNKCWNGLLYTSTQLQINQIGRKYLVKTSGIVNFIGRHGLTLIIFELFQAPRLL